MSLASGEGGTRMQPTLHSSPGHTLSIRLFALAEVILAAFAGSLFAPMLLVFSESRWMRP